VIVAAGLLIAGMGSLALVILALHKAPEGYEDERGFDAVSKVYRGVPCPGFNDKEHSQSRIILSSGHRKLLWRDPVKLGRQRGKRRADAIFGVDTKRDSPGRFIPWACPAGAVVICRLDNRYAPSFRPASLHTASEHAGNTSTKYVNVSEGVATTGCVRFVIRQPSAISSAIP
jgi:hypothetical protein